MLLLFCSAMISGSEVAFFSLTHNDWEYLRKSNGPSAKRILHLLERPQHLLATVLIANNFVNVAIVILSSALLSATVKVEALEHLATLLLGVAAEAGQVQQVAALIQMFIEVVLVTFALVLFGETAPKIYAKVNNIALAERMSGALLFLRGFFHPLIWVLVNSTQLIERRAMTRRFFQSRASEEDLAQAIDLTVRENNMPTNEVDILKGIVEFGKLQVRQAMRDRSEVNALEFSSNFTDILQDIRTFNYSRFPVYFGDFDNIVGILYAKDLLQYLDEDKDFEWQSLIRLDVVYAYENMKLSDLLDVFRAQRQHMAIVRNEYGGSTGLITLEDIMEEIVGDIRDEFDEEEERLYKKLDEHNFLFSGKCRIDDVHDLLGLPEDYFDEGKGNTETIAGFILEREGIIPKKGHEMIIKDYKFIIKEANHRRIDQVQIGLLGAIKKTPSA